MDKEQAWVFTRPELVPALYPYAPMRLATVVQEAHNAHPDALMVCESLRPDSPYPRVQRFLR